ncbi:hypothetical protein TNIN_407641 [Trichonephila inaurata madagascariensis]|uniref:Uncharacterized protein n=1 Tax=Trichonephila inaurata madagascariensis TaxID=2747483 RepID=A0A8X6XIK8_9ARAC|nr:hypothetical protein TNIN_407641 [Trichonephila inaurata madagascariensis]
MTDERRCHCVPKTFGRRDVPLYILMPGQLLPVSIIVTWPGAIRIISHPKEKPNKTVRGIWKGGRVELTNQCCLFWAEAKSQCDLFSNYLSAFFPMNECLMPSFPNVFRFGQLGHYQAVPANGC